MQLIQTVTVGSGGAANIEFTSIPATFTDLYLVVSIRTLNSGTVDGLRVRPNGSTANFNWRRLAGDGSTRFSDSDPSTEIALVNGNGATSNTFGNASVYIPNYLASANKSFSGDSVTENNATTAYQALYAGIWNQTTAISSLTISAASTNNLMEHSSASLYGILAGSSGGVVVS